MFKHKSQKQLYADYAIKNGQNLDESTLNLYTKELKKEVDDAYNLISIFANLEPLKYESTTEYREGEIVSHNGTNYIAIKDTVGNEPPNDKFWSIFDDFATSANLSKLTDFLSKTNQTPYNPEDLSPGETSTAYHPATLKFVEDRIDFHLKNSVITNSDRLDGFHASHFATKEELNSINLNIQTDTTMYDPYKLPFTIEDIPTIVETPKEEFKNVLDTNNFEAIFENIKKEKKYFLKLGKNQITHYDIKEIEVEYQAENPDYVPPTPDPDASQPVTRDLQTPAPIIPNPGNTDNTGDSKDPNDIDNPDIDTTSPTLTKTKIHRILSLGIAGPFENLGFTGYTNGLIFMRIEYDTLNDEYVNIEYSSNCYKEITEFDYKNLQKKLDILQYIIIKNEKLDEPQNINLEKVSDDTYKLVWKDPENKKLGNTITAHFQETSVTMKCGGIPQDENDGDLLVTNTEPNKYEIDGLEINLNLSGEYFIRLFSKSAEGLITSSKVLHISYTRVSEILTLQINEDTSEITTNFDKLTQEELIEFFGIYPCLMVDGVEETKLNPDDYTKSSLGDTVDITTLGRDVMVAFPRRGLRLSKEGNIITIKMTKMQNSPDFDYYAHTYGEERKNIFYLGAYPTYFNDEKGYSSSSKAYMASSANVNSTNIEKNIFNRGNSYTYMGFYQLLYIQCLYLFYFKKLDFQFLYTTGTKDSLSGTTNTSKYFTNDNDTRVSGLENFLSFWTQETKCLIGGTLVNSTNANIEITKGPYGSNVTEKKGVITFNFDTLKNQNKVISKVKGTSEEGFLPIEGLTQDEFLANEFLPNQDNLQIKEFSNFGGDELSLNLLDGWLAMPAGGSDHRKNGIFGISTNTGDSNITARLLCFSPKIQFTGRVEETPGTPEIPSTQTWDFLTDGEIKTLGMLSNMSDLYSFNTDPNDGTVPYAIGIFDTSIYPSFDKGLRYFKAMPYLGGWIEITKERFEYWETQGVQVETLP